MAKKKTNVVFEVKFSDPKKGRVCKEYTTEKAATGNIDKMNESDKKSIAKMQKNPKKFIGRKSLHLFRARIRVKIKTV